MVGARWRGVQAYVRRRMRIMMRDGATVSKLLDLELYLAAKSSDQYRVARERANDVGIMAVLEELRERNR